MSVRYKGKCYFPSSGTHLPEKKVDKNLFSEKNVLLCTSSVGLTSKIYSCLFMGYNVRG